MPGWLHRSTATTAAAATTALLVGSSVLAGLAGSAAADPSRPGAKDPSPGGETVHDHLFPHIGNTGYDARHYTIRLRYFHGGTISALSTMSAVARHPLSRFSLDLEGLTVSRVWVDGRRASYSRHDDKLVVTPSEAPLGRFRVSVAYSGRPATHIDPDGAKDGWIPTSTGATVLSEPVGAQTWFPNNNTPRDKATYTVTVGVPQALKVAGNGDLASRRTHGSRTSWTWEQSRPMASYLAMISIARYDLYRSTVRLDSGRKLPVWSFVQPSLGKLARERALIPRILRFEERRFGRYPFTSAGIVVADLGVGYALETQNRPVFDGVPDVDTEVHELAHQWYGDSVTPRNWVDVWLNEGFATYAERLWEDAHGGPSPHAWFQRTYDGNPASSGLWTPAPADFDNPADLFGSQVYTRGAMTLQALRQRVGSRDFARILSRWAYLERGHTVTTADFIALCERITGRDLDSLFHRWLYVAEKPAGY